MSAIIETPSKAAAASLSALDLTKTPLVLETVKVAAAGTRKHDGGSKEDETTNDGRDRFVGDLSIKCDKDEPLLKESANRFVLFPIKYHEVGPVSRKRRVPRDAMEC